MALFVISWMDKPDSLEVRMAAREAHLAYLAKTPGKVALGGPFIDAEGRMIGSMMIYEGDSLQEAEAFHREDPYTKAGLFERSQVRPWRATVGALATGS